MFNLNQSASDNFRAQSFRSTDREKLLQVGPQDFDFSAAACTAVISSAQKFVIAVPRLPDGGEPLLYPAGHPKAAQPITDWEGKPVGERGIVFFNDKDKCWQAVAGDGSGIIIINQVPDDKAALLINELRQCGEGKLSLPEIKALLQFTREELKLGDMYNSTRDFAARKLSPVRPALYLEGSACGLMKRDDRDICLALYVPGRFAFEGPASSAQIFENGGVLVKSGAGIHGVQPEIFAQTYRHASGAPISSAAAEIKAQNATGPG